MVAMYVIFLGIIPSVLLVMFLVYYSRHNVLYWWKKPRKSYVDYLLCNWNAPDKGAYTNRFKKRTSSLRNLLSFKRNKNATSEACDDNPPAQTQKPVRYKITDFSENGQKKLLKKPTKRINKEDIQIGCDPKRPQVPPKPNDIKPNLVIIKQGLASTTNEMVFVGHKRMYNVGNNGYADMSGANVKVHGRNKI